MTLHVSKWTAIFSAILLSIRPQEVGRWTDSPFSSRMDFCGHVLPQNPFGSRLSGDLIRLLLCVYVKIGRNALSRCGVL
jgi:hypothetical protein